MSAFHASHTTLVISVVSHGHGPFVAELLQDVARLNSSCVRRVVLTLNRADEPDLVGSGPWPFILEVRRNQEPLGFGENHNRALQGAQEDCVCVLNPDVRLPLMDPFAPLTALASMPQVGCAYPVQVDEQGRVQDSERALLTPGALWNRRVRGRSEGRLDWVNAACLVIARPVWSELGGFDERYFMYCEDVDLCLRMRLRGFSLVRGPVSVVHAGQRDSHRKWPHLLRHMSSLLRFWRSPVYRAARHLLPMDTSVARSIGGP